MYERVEGASSSNVFLGFVVATATERGFGASIWTLQSLILSRLVPTYRTAPLRLPSPFTSMKFLPVVAVLHPGRPSAQCGQSHIFKINIGWAEAVGDPGSGWAGEPPAQANPPRYPNTHTDTHTTRAC